MAGSSASPALEAGQSLNSILSSIHQRLQQPLDSGSPEEYPQTSSQSHSIESSAADSPSRTSDPSSGTQSSAAVISANLADEASDQLAAPSQPVQLAASISGNSAHLALEQTPDVSQLAHTDVSTQQHDLQSDQLFHCSDASCADQQQQHSISCNEEGVLEFPVPNVAAWPGQAVSEPQSSHGSAVSLPTLPEGGPGACDDHDAALPSAHESQAGEGPWLDCYAMHATSAALVPALICCWACIRSASGA